MGVLLPWWRSDHVVSCGRGHRWSPMHSRNPSRPKDKKRSRADAARSRAATLPGPAASASLASTSAASALVVAESSVGDGAEVYEQCDGTESRSAREQSAVRGLAVAGGDVGRHPGFPLLLGFAV